MQIESWPIDKLLRCNHYQVENINTLANGVDGSQQCDGISPVVVDRNLILLAGKNRLIAAKNAGHTSIRVVYFDSLSKSAQRNGIKDIVCEKCGKEVTIRRDSKTKFCKPCACYFGGKSLAGRTKVGRKKCKGCDNSIPVTSNKEYCSVECRSKDLRVGRVCETCKKVFYVLKSAMSEKTNSSGRYCSRSCYGKALALVTGEKSQRYRSVKVPCGYCGKELLRIPSKLNRTPFCSIDCRSKFHSLAFSGENNPMWRGGIISRNGFNAVRKKYFSGVQFCALCGTTKKIHIHHIIPYRVSKDNSIKNLIPLCVSCHRKVEASTNRMLSGADWSSSFDLAFMLLSNRLRSRQQVTYAHIKNLHRGWMNETV